MSADAPAYLRWSLDDEIAYDDGALQVYATLCQRRDGAWVWAATVAAYGVAFDANGNTSDRLGPALSSGPKLADDEAGARSACATWIESARLDRLGLAHVKQEVPNV